MHEGIVFKAYGGFCYIKSGVDAYTCVLRGRLRRENRQVLVGDRVKFICTGAGKGVVESVLPRRSMIARPPVANVDWAIIVFAMRDPDPSSILLDRLLVHVRAACVTPVICFNKADLGAEKALDLISVYREVGYRFLVTSAKEGTGLGDLKKILHTGVSVLAGPSGVGKSSLLNALEPGLFLNTGKISQKLGRGRHITRHVELIPLTGGGLVADTPGFTSLYLPPVKPIELAGFFSEFGSYAKDCYFAGCLHYKEPGCAVKKAWEDSKISMPRYNNYVKLLTEIMTREKRKYD